MHPHKGGAAKLASIGWFANFNLRQKNMLRFCVTQLGRHIALLLTKKITSKCPHRLILKKGSNVESTSEIAARKIPSATGPLRVEFDYDRRSKTGNVGDVGVAHIL